MSSRKTEIWEKSADTGKSEPGHWAGVGECLVGEVDSGQNPKDTSIWGPTEEGPPKGDWASEDSMGSKKLCENIARRWDHIARWVNLNTFC